MLLILLLADISGGGSPCPELVTVGANVPVPKAMPAAIRYADVYARVSAGESLTIDMATIVDPPITGVYRCWRSADGRPMFERVAPTEPTPSRAIGVAPIQSPARPTFTPAFRVGGS